MLVSLLLPLLHTRFLLLRLFIVMFGHLRFLAFQATHIIWLCWMILLSFAGLSLFIESLMCTVTWTWLISLLTLAHRLAFLSNAFRLIMALSSSTSPPYRTWWLMGSCFDFPVHIPHPKTARPSVFFVPSTTPCAHSSSMHPCRLHTGSRPLL